MRVAIVGGGIIGLSIGWQLVRKGCEVEIFEREKAGRQASWAAAGMLSPYAEAGFEEDLRMGEESLRLYPKFLEELSEDSGKSLLFESHGTLFAGIDRDDRAHLERIYLDQKQKGRPLEWLSGSACREMEPLLSPRATCGIWIEREAGINNRTLIEALIRAFLSRGGVLREQCPVSGIWEEKGALKGIFIPDPIPADAVILASGAWASSIRPNKGQILTLRMEPGMALSRVIRTPRVYFAPKQNGTVRVGATSEEVGFDNQVTAGGVLELLQAAFEAIPSTLQMPFEEALAAPRPAAARRTPLIEETELKGYFRAVGHGRAGILLAPYTAYYLVNLIRGKQHEHSSEWKTVNA